jgi:hypothetical protein
LAQWAAMAAPIVPAPSTATFLILCDIRPPDPIRSARCAKTR